MVSQSDWSSGALCSIPGAIIAIVLFSSTVHIIEPGHVGITVEMGTIGRDIRTPGVQLTAPWHRLITFSTKRDIVEQKLIVPTQDGLNVELEVALIYYLNQTEVRSLYTTFGTEYVKKLVAPTLASASRSATSQAETKSLYTVGRVAIVNQLEHDIKQSLEKHGIVMDQILLKSILLPKSVRDAIDRKVQAQQDSERMEFILAKEKQEAERKAVEAKGIADFQRIVSAQISDGLLRWKGIEATERLAASENAKMVFIGNGKDALPAVLAGGDK